eukprot:gene21525-27560_t
MNALEVNDTEHEIKAGHSDLNWADEEEIANEIASILHKLDESDVASTIKNAYSKKVEVSTARLAKLFEKQKLMSLAADVDESLNDMLHDQMHNQEADKSGAPSHKDNVVQMMLQKKIVNLKKQLDMSDQKARSATLQWVSDKVRYKEENDSLRGEKDLLNTKMIILDKQVRQNEQMLRDKYMIEGGKEAGEMSEEDKLKLMLFNSDKDLKDNREKVADLSTELSALKVDLREANESVRVLSDRVEEILKSEDSLNDQLESSEKARRDDMRRMNALEEELGLSQGAEAIDKERIADLERNMREIKKDNETAQIYLKKSVSDLQGIVENLVQEKENLALESHNKIAAMRREMDYLRIERDNLALDHKLLTTSLQSAGTITSKLVEELLAHKHLADRTLTQQRDQCDVLQRGVKKLSRNMKNILEEARTRSAKIQAAFDEFQIRSATQIDSLEKEAKAASSKIKGLQYQVDNAQQLLLTAVAEAHAEEEEKRVQLVEELKEETHKSEKLERDVEAMRRANADLEHTIRTLKEQKHNLESDLHIVKEENSDFMFQVAELKMGKNEASRELKHVTEELQLLTTQHATLVADHEATSEALVVANAAIEENKAIIAHADQEAHELEEKLKEAEKLSKTMHSPGNIHNHKGGRRTSNKGGPPGSGGGAGGGAPAQKRGKAALGLMSGGVNADGTESAEVEWEEYEPSIDIGMPDFSYQEDDAPDKAEVEEPIRLDMSMERVEELVRQSVITDNFFFSEKSNSFTNDYPLDEGFINDMIAAFHTLSQSAIGLVERSTTKTSNRFELESSLSQELENLLLKSAKDLVVKMHKNKEDAVDKVKMDFMKAEMDGGGMADTKRNITSIEESSDAETPHDGGSRQDSLQFSPRSDDDSVLSGDHIEPAGGSPSRRKSHNKHDASPMHKGSPRQPMSKDSPRQQKGGKKDPSPQHKNSPHLRNKKDASPRKKSEVEAVQQYDEFGRPTSAKLDAEAAFTQMGRTAHPNAAQPSSNESAMQVKLNSYEREIAALKEQLHILNDQRQYSGSTTERSGDSGFHAIAHGIAQPYPLEMNDENSEEDTPRNAEEEAAFQAQLAEFHAMEVAAEAQAEEEKVLNNATASCDDAEIAAVVEENVLSEEMQQLAAEKVDENALKAALASGALNQIGEVRTENFERLKRHEFGPDELVSLTVIEHHLNFDPKAGGSSGVSSRTVKMQMRSLEIQRDAIQDKLMETVTVLDLMTYKHNTEKHLVMLDSMSVWRRIMYLKDGGQFKDVLLLHLEVIDRCIEKAGGWKVGLQVLNSENDLHVDTQSWPEFFRVKALETLRIKMLKDLDDKKNRLEHYHQIIHAKNTEGIINKRGTILDSIKHHENSSPMHHSNSPMNSSRSVMSGGGSPSMTMQKMNGPQAPMSYQQLYQQQQLIQQQMFQHQQMNGQMGQQGQQGFPPQFQQQQQQQQQQGQMNQYQQGQQQQQQFQQGRPPVGGDKNSEFQGGQPLVRGNTKKNILKRGGTNNNEVGRGRANSSVSQDDPNLQNNYNNSQGIAGNYNYNVPLQVQQNGQFPQQGAPFQQGQHPQNQFQNPGQPMQFQNPNQPQFQNQFQMQGQQPQFQNPYFQQPNQQGQQPYFMNQQQQFQQPFQQQGQFPQLQYQSQDPSASPVPPSASGNKTRTSLVAPNTGGRVSLLKRSNTTNSMVSNPELGLFQQPQQFGLHALHESDRHEDDDSSIDSATVDGSRAGTGHDLANNLRDILRVGAGGVPPPGEQTAPVLGDVGTKPTSGGAPKSQQLRSQRATTMSSSHLLDAPGKEMLTSERNPLLIRKKDNISPKTVITRELSGMGSFTSTRSSADASQLKGVGGPKKATKKTPLVKQFTSSEIRFDEILKTLHINADKIVLGALYEEENALELLSRICDGIEFWHDNKHQTALKSFESCCELRLGGQMIQDLTYVLEASSKVVPPEVSEVYEKMIYIVDYCGKLLVEREQAAILASKKHSQPAPSEIGLNQSHGSHQQQQQHQPLQNNNVYYPPDPQRYVYPYEEQPDQQDTQGDLQMVDPSDTTHKARVVSPGYDITGKTSQYPGMPNIVYLDPPKPTVFDCSTQTVGGIDTVPGTPGLLALPVFPVSVPPVSGTNSHNASHASLSRASTTSNVKDVKVALSRSNTSNKQSQNVDTSFFMKDLLPISIICAHVTEGEFELSPGVFFATHSKLDDFLANAGKTLKDFSMPPSVRYCIRAKDAMYDVKLKIVPSYLNVPQVPGCEAVLFPPVYELQQGVHLLTNHKECSGVNIDLPKDVVVLQVMDNAELPRGLTMVELSPLIKTPTHVLNEVLPGHQLVQIMTGSELSLPVGTEVARGVRIAALPPEMELPPNICIVKRQNQAMLPDYMVPVGSASKEEDESLFIHLRMNDGCVVVQKPLGIDFRLGMEILRRPQGMPLPPFMTLVPIEDYPDGLKLDESLALVQLLPRFDFPRTCKISPTWYVLPRPLGMRIPPGVLIVYPDPLRLPATPLPPFACPVCMPDMPYHVKLPPLAQAVQLLHGSSDYALPEGALLAPGLTVVDLGRFLSASSSSVTRPPTPNVLLVKREPNTQLPFLVERGNREDLPPGTLLSEGLEILRVAVRFELPAGVKLDVGVHLGPCTQLAPGTILSRHLEVQEWPYGLQLTPGTELVRLPTNYNLPSEFQLVSTTNRIPLPTGSHIVKLPRSVVAAPPRMLSSKITVGIESMVADKSLPLPSGVVFASRESKKSLWPAEVMPLPKSALHPRVVAALDKINSESSIGGAQQPSKGGKMAAAVEVGTGMNIEAVQLVPHFSLPPGAQIVPGVTVVQKPFWLHAPRFVELVSVPADKLNISMGKGVTRIRLRPEYLKIEKTLSELGEEDVFGTPTLMRLPENTVLVQLSDAFQMHSWGPYLPGVEAVQMPTGRLYLPRCHYLIQRPRRKRGEELPPGFKIGLANEFKNLVLPTPDPSVEVMHIVPTFHLPPGVTVINSSVLCKNSFNSSPLTNSGRFDLNWVPQLSAGDYIAAGCSVIKHPPCNVFLNELLTSDPFLIRDPHAFVRIDNQSSFILPSNFSYHARSSEIVESVWGENLSSIIKLIRISNGLPTPRDRFKKEYGTAKYFEAVNQLARTQTAKALLQQTEPVVVNANIDNNHIEVFRVLSTLNRTSTRPEDLVNNFLTQLSVFRLNAKQNKEDYKFVKKSKEFSLLDAGLLKLKDAADRMDGENAWLKKQVEVLILEKRHLVESNEDLEDRNDELNKMHLVDEELKFLVAKLNNKLIEKTAELNNYLATRNDASERQQVQIDVLTTQLADWQHGAINPEEDFRRSEERKHAADERKAVESVARAAHEDSGAARAEENAALLQAYEKQLAELKQQSQAMLSAISKQYCDSLVSLTNRLETISSAVSVPNNTALIALKSKSDNDYLLWQRAAMDELSMAGDSVSGASMSYARVASPPALTMSFNDEEAGEEADGDIQSLPYPHYKHDLSSGQHHPQQHQQQGFDEDDISLLTDGADRTLAAALAGRIKPKEIGRKPQSMTLSSFAPPAARAEDDEFMTIARSIPGPDGQRGGIGGATGLNGAKKKHVLIPSARTNQSSAAPLTQEIILSKSVNDLMNKVKKGTAVQQLKAKLPKLSAAEMTEVGIGPMSKNGDSILSPSRVSQHNRLLVTNVKPSEFFRSAVSQEPTTLAGEAAQQAKVLKDSIVSHTENMFVQMDKRLQEALVSALSQPLLTVPSDGSLLDEDELSVGSTVHTASLAPVTKQLKRSLLALSDKIVAFFQHLHDLERGKYIRSLEGLELEVKCLTHALKTSDNRCELLQCFLAEAKNRNNDYGAIAHEGLREKIWILETKIEKLLDLQTKGDLSAVQSQVETLQQLIESERNLKFVALTLKQRAAQEEADFRDRHVDVISKNDAALNEMKKEKLAVQQHTATLRHKSKLYKERSENVHAEIDGLMGVLGELIQSYDRAVQAVVPAKIQASLLKIGAHYFQDLNSTASGAVGVVGGGGAVGSNKLQPMSVTVDTSDDQSQVSNFTSDMMYGGGGASVSSGRSMASGMRVNSSTITAQRALESASKSLNNSNVKFGSIGSMPPAAAQSHLIARNNAGIYHSGHNNRPALK